MEFKPISQKAATSIRLSRQHQFSVFAGSVRSGKTITALIAFVEVVVNAPKNAPMMILAKDLSVIQRNLINPLIAIYPGKIKPVYGSGRVEIFGRDVYLLGFNNERSVNSLQGKTLYAALVDEATLMPESFFNMLLSRFSEPGARAIFTTNPDSQNHYFKKGFLDDAECIVEKDGHVYRTGTGSGILHTRWTIDDNPSLTDDYRRMLRQRYPEGTLWHRRFILGDWVANSGGVYEILDLSEGSRMRWDEPPTGRLVNTFVGIDHGMTNNTAAIVTCVYSNNEGTNAYVMSEKLLEGVMTVNQQAVALSDWLRDGAPDARGVRCIPVTMPGDELDPRVFIDPAAKAFRTEWDTLGNGFPERADNAVLTGIQTVGNLLDGGRLKINPSATPKLVTELEGYVWDPKATAAGTDKPIKRRDHLADGLRYSVQAADKWL